MSFPVFSSFVWPYSGGYEGIWGRPRAAPNSGIRLSASGGDAAGGAVSGAEGRAPVVLCGGRCLPGDGAMSVGGAGSFVLSRGPVSRMRVVEPHGDRGHVR